MAWREADSDSRTSDCEDRLSRYIDELNRGRTPQAHHLGLPRGEDGLYETVRSILAARDPVPPSPGFKYQLFSRLGRPIASVKLQAGMIRATLALIVVAALVGLSVLLAASLHAGRGVTASEEYTVSYRAQSPGSNPLGLIWSATAPGDSPFDKIHNPWLGLDRASGFALLRLDVGARYADEVIIDPAGTVWELGAPIGHLKAFSANASGAACLTFVDGVPGDVKYRVVAKWVDTSGQTDWEQVYYLSGSTSQMSAAELSLAPDGSRLLVSFLEGGRDITNSCPPSVLLVEAGKGAVKRYSPPVLPQLSPDWAANQALAAWSAGAGTELALLSLSDLSEMARVAVGGVLVGEPVLTHPEDDEPVWWVAASDTLYRVAGGPDSGPAGGRAGPGGGAGFTLGAIPVFEGPNLSFTCTPGGWCLAKTSEAVALLRPDGSVAWKRVAEPDVLASACTEGGTLSLLVYATPSVAHSLRFEAVGPTGVTIWVEDADGSADESLAIAQPDESHLVCLREAGPSFVLTLDGQSSVTASEVRYSLPAGARVATAAAGKLLTVEFVENGQTEVRLYDLRVLVAGR